MTSSQIVTGSPVMSGSGAVTGTTLTASATCPAGKVLLGGGGTVTNNDQDHPERSVLTQSFPASSTTWHAVGVVSGANLAGSKKMTVQAWAICTV